MKKFLTLLISIFILSSCSSDDDAGEETDENDIIIGTWILTEVDPDDGFSNCEAEESTFEFSANNEIKADLYMYESCFHTPITGNWENTSGSNYLLEINTSDEEETITLNDPNKFVYRMNLQDKDYEFTFEKQ